MTNDTRRRGHNIEEELRMPLMPATPARIGMDKEGNGSPKIIWQTIAEPVVGDIIQGI